MIAPASDIVIDVQGLTKSYGARMVVDHVDIRVERGRIYGFLGPNGSGKTTTIRMLCGLLTPDEGQGQCLGYDIRLEARQIKKQVGYMTQKFGLYDDLSIEENLDFVARVYQVAKRRQRIADTLERLGLASRRAQLAGSLSGGWKQRLALAACLIHDPQLLLLDEPTAGVDPSARRAFWDQIHDLAAAGMTVLVSTHYMDEAERCHQLAYIAYGKLLARGSVAEVIASAGLHTWSLTGPDLNSAAHSLRGAPGIRTVAPFGMTLHVSANSADALAQALAPPALARLAATPIETSLEDVFIALMQDAQDNFGGAAP
ncbi:ABC transporter ATP-binding protein [Massilia violaceinigra]|uniref:ABC transporter ATP-binding protein n=1 Tax=Massilia violaceinigra TaxID=2045208 RepID=A0ABY4ADQ8_9BURK|nr:ABC transporter ATP-binding protein [Massilia violaceinigra]UOD32712.1 ABC transporter ATP-binding protein [Massilia violaceinigra]